MPEITMPVPSYISDYPLIIKAAPLRHSTPWPPHPSTVLESQKSLAGETFSDLCERHFKLHTIHQSLHLDRFAIPELAAMGAWPSTQYGFDAKIPSKTELINTPIHPLFARERWMQGTQIIGQIGDGKGGFREELDFGRGPGVGWDGRPIMWDMKEDRIWEAFDPILRLASRLLTGTIAKGWLDALVHADWDPIPISDLDDGIPYDHPCAKTPRRVKLRDPQVANDPAAVAQVQLSLKNMSKNFYIRFAPSEDAVNWTDRPIIPAIKAGYRQDLSQLERKRQSPGFVGSAMAFHVARTERLPGGSDSFHVRYVTLHTEIVEQLFGDLSESEKIVTWFNLAITLCHETIHAFGHYVGSLKKLQCEPFLEEEEISELGHSWTVAAIGSTIRLGSNNYEKAPPGPTNLVYSDDWPSIAHYKDGKFTHGISSSRYRKATRFTSGSSYISWPIQLSYMENLFRAAFWNNCNPFRNSAIRPARILGKEYACTAGTRPPTIIIGVDAQRFLQETGSPFVPGAILMGGLPSTASEMEKACQAYAQSVRRASLNTILFAQHTLKTGLTKMEIQRQQMTIVYEEGALLQAFNAYDPADETRAMNIYADLIVSTHTPTRMEIFTCTNAFRNTSEKTREYNTIALGYEVEMLKQNTNISDTEVDHLLRKIQERANAIKTKRFEWDVQQVERRRKEEAEKKRQEEVQRQEGLKRKWPPGEQQTLGGKKRSPADELKSGERNKMRRFTFFGKGGAEMMSDGEWEAAVSDGDFNM